MVENEFKRIYRIFNKENAVQYDTIDDEIDSWLRYIFKCYSYVFTFPYSWKIEVSPDMEKTFIDFLHKRGEYKVDDGIDSYIFQNITIPNRSIYVDYRLCPKCIQITWKKVAKPACGQKYCADCIFFHPEKNGECGSYNRRYDKNHYPSDKACKYFVASDKPKPLYLRTKYDGVLRCPCCGRNFNWCNSLRNDYVEENIANYIPDRATNLRIRVFNKTCNQCGKSFKFLYDKITNEYKYFSTNGKQYYSPAKLPGIGEKEMGPDGFEISMIELALINDKPLPKIKEVKFNGPATIIFWEDETKTVVKHDGKGRKDKRMGILYAYIKKIYGPGKEYHKVLSEIEKAIK